MTKATPTLPSVASNLHPSFHASQTTTDIQSRLLKVGPSLFFCLFVFPRNTRSVKMRNIAQSRPHRQRTPYDQDGQTVTPASRATTERSRRGGGWARWVAGWLGGGSGCGERGGEGGQRPDTPSQCNEHSLSERRRRPVNDDDDAAPWTCGRRANGSGLLAEEGAGTISTRHCRAGTASTTLPMAAH